MRGLWRFPFASSFYCIQKMLVLYLEFFHLGNQFSIALLELSQSFAIVNLINTCIVLFDHVDDVLELSYGLFLGFQQLDIVEFHGVGTIHFPDATDVVTSLKIFRSVFSHYFDSSVPNS